MTPHEFIPLGEALTPEDGAPFIRIAGPGGVEEEAPIQSAAVTPAEANDLPGQIRQILQKHLSGADLEKTAAAISASAAAAPARMALPEFKLTPASDAVSEPGEDTEPAAPPTIELEREDDAVRRIKIRCSCGQSIQLDCDY